MYTSNGYINDPRANGLAVVFVVLMILLSIAMLVAICKIYTKAGAPWERLFVPVYGPYWFYRIADCSRMFFTNITLGLLMPLSGALPSELGMLFLYVIAGIALILHLVFSIRLAKAFGKGAAFAIGLFLLYPVFIMILGYGSAKYKAGDISHTRSEK